MLKGILGLAILAAACTAAPAFAQTDAASEIIALERKALDGWAEGNPDPLLAACDAGVTYFHVMTLQRLDGLASVKALVEPFRGQSLYDSYEMSEPKVQVVGDAAVLSYILVQRRGSTSSRWNGTQVYQKKDGRWRVIHTHWSQTAPAPGTPAAAR